MPVRSVATVPNPTMTPDTQASTHIQVQAHDGTVTLDVMLEERRPSETVKATMIQARLNDDDLDWLIGTLSTARVAAAQEQQLATRARVLAYGEQEAVAVTREQLREMFQGHGDIA